MFIRFLEKARQCDFYYKNGLHSSMIDINFTMKKSTRLFMRPGMGPVVNVRQMLKIQVRVDLRRTDITMPQQLLNRPNILTAFQQMTGERMP